MSNLGNTKVSIRLPNELLAQIDDLAARDFGSRSTAIRQALLNYVRQPVNEVYLKRMWIARAKSLAINEPMQQTDDDDGMVEVNGMKIFDPELKAALQVDTQDKE